MTVSEWVEAMRAEADQPRGVAERVSWHLGVMTTTCRLLITHAVRSTTPTRPLVATYTSIYFAAFATFVATRLALEIATNRVPPLLGHSWLSIARCLGLIAAALVVTLALWHRRRIGPPLAMAFAGLQFLTALFIN